jgi:hypothetical protein
MKTFNDRVRPIDCAAYVLFALLVGIILLTFRDYGVNSDEIAHVTNGHIILDYYRTLFAKGLSPATHAFYQSGHYEYDMYRYGGLVDAFATVMAQAMPLRTVETWHLTLALIGLFGVVGCWKLARWMAGPRAAFGAALMLALVPAYYGHMFNNPKDVPFAAFYVWGVYYIVRLVTCERRAPWTLTLRTGLAMGACMGVRSGGLLLPVYLVFFMCVRNLAMDRQSWREWVRSFATAVLPAILVAYAVMFASWPWIHAAPLARPFMALSEVTSRKIPYITVLFDGRIFTPDTLPVTYTIWQMAIQLPLLIEFLATAGLILAMMLRLRGRSRWRDGIGPLNMVLFSAVFPLVYAALRHAPVYNGFRHFLFVVPPLVCLAAVALAWLDEICTDRFPNIRRIGAIVFMACMLWMAVAMIRLHPYQYIYYNALVGGVRGAQGRYELDYYCHTYAGAVRRLDGLLRERYGLPYANMHFRVHTGDNPFSSTPFFPNNWEYATDASSADYVIDKVLQTDATVLATITRCGVPLNYVMTPPAQPLSPVEHSLERKNPTLE